MATLPGSQAAEGGGGGPPPVVGVEAVLDPGEDGTPGIFRIFRLGDLSQPLRVRYRVGGTARVVEDFERLPGEILLPAGAAEGWVTVVPNTDHRPEPAETVTLTVVPRDAPFTLVVLPDTQYYTAERQGGVPEMFDAQTRWIADQASRRGIAFVLHEGDVTENNTEPEWQRGRAALAALDGVVPYAVAVGNHDGLNSPVSQTELFNTYFGPAEYAGRPGFGGRFEPERMDNCYWLFEAGGVAWLVLVLEFGPRDEVLAWADAVLRDHPERAAILLTHSHVYYDDTLHGSDPAQEWQPQEYGRQNNGAEVWEKLIRRHPQLRFVFSGHDLGDGTGRLTLRNDAGRDVYQMLANYQVRPAGGYGFLRLLTLYPGRDRLEVRTYSPYSGQWLRDAENEFAYEPLGLFPSATPDLAVDPTHATATVTLADLPDDPTPPQLVWYDYQRMPPVFRLEFDRELDPSSAEDAAHYQVTGWGAPASIRLQPDGRSVLLHWAGEPAGNPDCSLRVEGLRGRNPHAAASPLVEAAFRYRPALMREAFGRRGLEGWRPVDTGREEGPSLWITSRGRAMQSSRIHGPDLSARDRRQGTSLVWDDLAAQAWTDFTVSAEFQTFSPGGAGVMWRWQNASNYYLVEFDAEARFSRVLRRLDGQDSTLAYVPEAPALGRPHLVRVECAGPEFVIRVDGTNLFDGPVIDPELRTGTVALYAWANMGLAFRGVEVSPLERAPRVRLLRPGRNGQAARLPDAVVLEAEAEGAGSDAAIERVEFYAGARWLGEVTAPPYAFEWAGAPVGRHPIVARVMDQRGLASATPARWFEVRRPFAPPSLVVSTTHAVAFAGDDALLHPVVQSEGPVRFQWLRNGQELPGATNEFLLLLAVQPQQLGVYQLRASWRQGEVYAAPVAFEVRTPPAPQPQGQRPPPVIRGVRATLAGQRVLTVEAAPHSRVVLETSLDLRDWQMLEVRTNASTYHHFTDARLEGEARGFYRARELGPAYP